jgi:carboxypeptidase family protein
MQRAPFTFFVVLGIVITPVHAQLDTTARLAGTVRSSINGLPISGVMVAVRGSRVFDVSDSTGSFTLVGLPGGRQTVRILYGDSLSYEHDITLKRGKALTLSVLLDIAAVELSPIVVEARGLRAERSLAGFYERKQWSFGRFYTLADLEKRASYSLDGLLGEVGVQVVCRLGTCLPIGFDGARRCVLSLYLDGMRMPVDYLNQIRVAELAGVEVYQRGFDVPAEFRSGFRNTCGAVVAWSRR